MDFVSAVVEFYNLDVSMKILRFKWIGIAFFVCLFLAWFFAPASGIQGRSFLRPGDRLLFVGDSISTGNCYATIAKEYFTTNMPGSGIQVEVLSRSGGSAVDGLELLKVALEQSPPSVVFVMFGINDTGWNNKESLRKSLRFIKYLNQYADLREQYDFDLVFLREIPVISGRDNAAAAGKINGVLDCLQTAQSLLARVRGVPVIDVRGAYEEALYDIRISKPDFTFATDGIHPGAEGQKIIANEILRAVASDLPLASEARGALLLER